jgi:hypothetical protein
MQQQDTLQKSRKDGEYPNLTKKHQSKDSSNDGGVLLVDYPEDLFPERKGFWGFWDRIRNLF